MTLSQTMTDLKKAYKLLAVHAPHMLGGLEKIMVMNTENIKCPERACIALFTLPAPVLNTILTQTTEFQDLLNTATPHLSTLDHVPDTVCQLSEEALETLIVKGFPYHNLLSPNKARLLWMTKGKYHGAQAWKTAHPRKNPVISYWEGHGANLPNILCPDGVDLVEHTILNFSRIPKTQKLWDVIHQNIPDWRVISAMVLLNSENQLNRPYYVRRAFGDYMGDAFRRLLFPKTGHEYIQRAALKDKTPNIRALLQTPGHQRPETLDDLLSIVYG